MDQNLINVLIFLAGSGLAMAGQWLGRPVLTWLANLLKGMADKDGDGKPDVTDGPLPTPTQAPKYASFRAAGTTRLRQVALPSWLGLLVLFFPVLKDMISRALDALAERLGREPEPGEAVTVALDAASEWLDAEKRFYPVDKVPPG